MKKEKIFVAIYIVFCILTMANALTTFTGGYSVIEYATPFITLAFLIIAVLFIRKSKSRIKCFQYCALMCFSAVGEWLLQVPMQSYGYLDSSSQMIEFIGYFDLFVVIATPIAVLYAILKSFKI